MICMDLERFQVSHKLAKRTPMYTLCMLFPGMGTGLPPATADLTCVRQVRDPASRAIKAREPLRVPTVLSHDLKRLAGRTAIDESSATADDVRHELIGQCKNPRAARPVVLRTQH